jgi:translation initiation factor IF-2
MKGMLDPEFKEVVTSSADERQLFRLPNSNVIAGGYVTSGTIGRKDQVRVVREGIIVYDGTLASLKRFKDDVREVASGYECGIGIDKFNDLKEGDTLEFYRIEEVQRS